MFVWVRFGEVESPQRRCFCIDVTCDNLLDAVKQTVMEETLALMKRRDADLTSKLREAIAEEQPLAAKALRFDALQEPIPPEISAALDLARFGKTATDGKLSQLHASMVKCKGLGSCDIELMEPSSGVLQKLSNNPRKKAAGLLRAGNTYEAARLDKNPSGPPTATPLTFTLSATATSHAALA